VCGFWLGSRRYVFGVLDQKRVEWVVEAKRRGVDIADALGAAALFSLWGCGRGQMLKKPGGKGLLRSLRLGGLSLEMPM
jgi:hypothetical protein